MGKASLSPPFYVVGYSQPSPKPSFPSCIPLRVHALEFKQVRSPLPTVSFLSSVHCMRPSQLLGSKTVLCDPPAELNECYSQYKRFISGGGKPSVKDRMVNILHFAGCIVSVTATDSAIVSQKQPWTVCK